MVWIIPQNNVNIFSWTCQIDNLGNSESVLTALIKHSTYNGLETNVKCIYVNTVNEIVLG